MDDVDDELLLDDELGLEASAASTEVEGAGVDPVLLGTGYALYRHGQDRQADRISAEVWSAINHLSRVIGDSASDRPGSTLGYLEIPAGEPHFWIELLGQDGAVELLKDWVAGVGLFGSRSHVLLTAPETGLGRRTVARVAANEASAQMVELSAPFDASTLREARAMLGYEDVLFIDDLEVACQERPGVSQVAQLLHASPYGPSVLGSTTRPDLLPASIRDLFPVTVELDYYDKIALSVIAEGLFHIPGPHQGLLTEDDFLDLGILAEGSASLLAALTVTVRNRVARLGRRLTEDELLEVTCRVPRNRVDDDD